MKKHSIQSTVVAFSVLAFLVSTGLYAYMYGTTADLVKETLDARKLVMASQAARAQGKEVVRLYEDSSSKREQLLSFFVPAENAVDAILAMESIEDDSGSSVELSYIKSSPGDVKDRIGKVTSVVMVKGEWRQVMKALELFETLSYQKSIKNVSIGLIEAGETGKSASRWSLTFDISIATLQKI